MIAFFCRTPIHIFRTIQLKYEMFEKRKLMFMSFHHLMEQVILCKD